jgi:hypothetical protein
VTHHPAPETSAAPGAGTDWRAAWVQELDRLELDVQRAEAMLRSNEPDPEPLPEWEPPVMREPIPADLVPRARFVLERQLAVAHLITQRLSSTTQQRQLTDRIRGTASPDVPVYLDVSA